MHGESSYDSKMTFLEAPSDIVSDKVTIFEAAFWFYMTPQNPKPSMHDVVTKNFTPTTDQTDNGISNGFGTTILIINGAEECPDI